MFRLILLMLLVLLATPGCKASTGLSSTTNTIPSSISLQSTPARSSGGIRTSISAEANPFFIGQVVYPADDFSRTAPSKELNKMVQNGVTVINLTRDLVRVRFKDGTEHIYNWRWFVAKGPFRLTKEWVLENPFSVGQTVCAIPRSVGESFPDKGVVKEVQGELLKLESYDSFINFAHFQECQ